MIAELERFLSFAPAPTVFGSYVLVLRLAAPEVIPVGRLGDVPFPAGWLLYAGSALGPGGLRGRLAHHRRPVNRPHWHIDWLRARAPLCCIWYAESSERRECAWAAALGALPGARAAAPGFGASDCRCLAHLYAVPAPPEPAAFARLAGEPHLTVLEPARLAA